MVDEVHARIEVVVFNAGISRHGHQFGTGPDEETAGSGQRFVRHSRGRRVGTDNRRILRQAGVICLRLPPRSPNLSPHIERFMRSLKNESVGRLILFDEAALRRTVREFLLHYHGERNHQGLDNRIIEPLAEVGSKEGRLACRQRLGGLLRYYYRKAA